MPRLPLHIGLTGNIASGKSRVARQLAKLGATVIDADVLARDAIALGTPGYDAVVATFGRDVVSANGAVDRSALRKRVFQDSEARSALNAIVHPIVGVLRDAQFNAAAARGDRVVISDIPLLFEVGLEHHFDGIVVVDAPSTVRKERLLRDRGLSAADAEAMMAAQWPSARKRASATWVIDNDGTPAQLEGRVAALWHTILELADRQRPTVPAS